MAPPHGDPLDLGICPGHCPASAVFAPSLHALAQELVNAIKNGGVCIVIEQSLEPSMYWGNQRC